MNQSYDELLDTLDGLATSLDALHRQAARELAPAVERLIATRSRDVPCIERTLDRLLDHACHPDVLTLFKSLCRHYYHFAPSAAADYVRIYRKTWDVDENEESQTVKPGYKQTEVGVIPEEWKIVPLGELAEFVTSGSRGWAEFYSESGALFIRSQNVRDGRLDFADTEHVRPPSGAEGNRTRVNRNDLLITITGNSVGNVALVEHEFDEAYISQHVGIVRLRDAGLGEYVCRYLSPNSPGNPQIAGNQSGQSKPGLNLQNLRDFKIAVPLTHPEQRAIATALSDVDALLGALDRLIAKKRDPNKPWQERCALPDLSSAASGANLCPGIAFYVPCFIQWPAAHPFQTIFPLNPAPAFLSLLERFFNRLLAPRP